MYWSTSSKLDVADQEGELVEGIDVRVVSSEVVDVIDLVKIDIEGAEERFLVPIQKSCKTFDIL